MQFSSLKIASALSLTLIPGPSIFAGKIPAPPDLDQPVTFPQALQLALAADPELERLGMEAAVIEGQVEQARKRPNPVIGAELENVLGTGAFQGLDQFEITLGLSQTIETADKRALRTTLAESQREGLRWKLENHRAKIEAAVRAAFVQTLLDRETHILREEQVQLAEASLGEIERLAEAARASAAERTRAELAVKQETFALQRAERALTSSRQALAGWWGLIPAPAFSVAGEIQIEAPPPLEDLLGCLSATVALGRFAAEESQYKARLELEQAHSKPDFEVFGGLRYLREDGGDASFVLGIDLPWNLFDRNEGNIHSVRAQLEAVRLEKSATRRELERALLSAHRHLSDAYEEVKTLENDLRPAAEKTLEATLEGYERGQFTLLAVIESREALFAIRQGHLDALGRYASALLTIESLTRPSTS